MSLKIGIVGFPNVGKSTLFNSLLKKQVALAANYPFATIEPNIGIVEVPDERLEKISQIVKKEFFNPNSNREVPERIVSAVVEFVDIAGLVKGASSGQGLGNKFLAHIREVDAIVHLLRDFSDSNVIREGSTSPKTDQEVIEIELAMADLDIVQKRIVRLESELKKGNNLEISSELSLLKQILNRLESGKFEEASISESEKEIAKSLNLLFYKPKLIVFNIDEDEISKYEDIQDGNVYLCAKLENELASLDSESALDYMREIGLKKSGLSKLIQKGYGLLGLQTYFTAGPKEVRAWTIKKGFKAPQAASVIHTDFQKGFISADVISYEDYIKSESYKNAKSLGLVRNEGKDYVMKDGDIVEFKFNV
jgi:GTP-binding protein YchF